MVDFILVSAPISEGTRPEFVGPHVQASQVREPPELYENEKIIVVCKVR